MSKLCTVLNLKVHMKFLFKVLSILGVAMLLSSCSTNFTQIDKTKLVGTWEEVNQNGMALPVITLNQDGSASTQNSPIFTLDKWLIEDNQLRVIGKTKARGQSALFDEMYRILKLSDKELVLEYEKITYVYRKIN
ncbi:MAG: lipocalin family protein [Succinatimonas sp.]|jgi:hypothetical protein|nr:lipocalin family protein [Succinatimonas sp.]